MVIGGKWWDLRSVGPGQTLEADQQPEKQMCMVQPPSLWR